MDLWYFWAAVAGMVLALTALFVQALRRPPAPPSESADLRVYRDQLAEIERDLARGTLPAAEAERLRLEVSRRLLDADRKSGLAEPASSRFPTLAALAVLSLLTGAVWLYSRLGVPDYPDLPLAERLAMAEASYRNRPSQAEAEASTPQTAPTTAPDPAYLELIAKLRAALAARPDDQQGLALLARNEASLGNFAAASKALAHLIALKGGAATADDHAELAQHLIAAAGGFVSPEAEAQLTAALVKDPRNGVARYYSGLMFAQVGRPDRTFALWQPLLAEGPEDAPWIAPIRAGLQDVANRAGIKYSLPDGKGPSAADMQAAGEMSDAERQEMIKGMVGQLESRLMSDGGPVEDWVKLITSLGVLDDKERATAALSTARKAFAGQDAALAQIEAAGAGIAP